MSDCFRSCHEGRATRTTTQAARAGWRATERTDRVEESQKIRVSEDIRADCDGSPTACPLANMHIVELEGSGVLPGRNRDLQGPCEGTETCMASAVDVGSPLGIRVALAAPFLESFIDDVVSSCRAQFSWASRRAFAGPRHLWRLGRWGYVVTN